MNIQGKLHRITNVSAFVASYVKTGGKPTTGFVPWGKARVHLGTDFPGGEFAGGFIPPMSLKVDANSQGVFKFTVPDALAKARARVIGGMRQRGLVLAFDADFDLYSRRLDAYSADLLEIARSLELALLNLLAPLDSTTRESAKIHSVAGGLILPRLEVDNPRNWKDWLYQFRIF